MNTGSMCHGTHKSFPHRSGRVCVCMMVLLPRTNDGMVAQTRVLQHCYARSPSDYTVVCGARELRTRSLSVRPPVVVGAMTTTTAQPHIWLCECARRLFYTAQVLVTTYTRLLAVRIHTHAHTCTSQTQFNWHTINIHTNTHLRARTKQCPVCEALSVAI